MFQKKNEIISCFKNIITKHNSIDIVFNNVGISLFGEFQDFNTKDREKYINTNLWSVIHGTKISYEQMLKQKNGGHIINTASLGGIFPQPLSVLFSTTKHAIVGLSASLANVARVHGINISVLCTGFIKTPIFDNLYISDKFNKEKVIELIKKQKGITAEKCAERIIRKVSKKKVIITTDSSGKFYWNLYRFSPQLLTNAPKKIFKNYIESLKK